MHRTQRNNHSPNCARESLKKASSPKESDEPVLRPEPRRPRKGSPCICTSAFCNSGSQNFAPTRCPHRGTPVGAPYLPKGPCTIPGLKRRRTGKTLRQTTNHTLGIKVSRAPGRTAASTARLPTFVALVPRRPTPN